MASAFIRWWNAFNRRWNAVKAQIPLLNQIHLNFIFFHYAYIIGWVIVSSIIVYPGSQIAYIDALFLCSGAATQSGLNTVNLNQLHLYQQIVLYFVSMATTPIFIHGAVVFVRLYWFEKRFQHVARDARALRRTRSRMETLSENKADQDPASAERGVRGRSIVVLRNNTGDAREDQASDSGARARDEANAETESPDSKPTSAHSSSEDTETGLEPRLGLGSLQVPTQLSPEHHIAFLEKQRKNKGALRIPSPREYDRGGMPEALDEEVEEDKERAQPPSPRARRSSAQSEQSDQASPTDGPHITINEPDITRTRTRAPTFPRLDTRPTVRETKDANINPLGQTVTGRNAFRGFMRTLTEERDRTTLPYLSWNATVVRNSNFVDLTEEQRDELGGIEYRALKTLAVVLISYYVGFHLVGVLGLVPWIVAESRWGKIVEADGVGRPWWGIYTAQSAFNDVGFTLTPNSMESFETAVWPLLLMTFLIIIGNTAFPCMLRLIIWFLSSVTRQGTALWEELKFLLDHPRRCFTLLFPRNATWWLFGIVVALNGIDLFFFCILDLNDPVVTKLPPGLRVLDGLFQASSTRTAGFDVVSLSALHPAIQVSYMIMMYISVFPIAISMRRTNVYEEKSLGVYSHGEEEADDEAKTTPSYIGFHLRRQLSFDLWYVFLGLFVIAIAEGPKLENPHDYSFQLFHVLFEVVSAYGTVGLSFGYPGYDTSFSGQFNTVSKLVIIAMQIRGRHRGLPYSLDRAVLLPSDALIRHDTEDAERRRRRPSNLTGVGSFARPQSRAESRTDAGQSTGMDTQDWQPPRPSGDGLVHRPSTVRSSQ